MFNSLRDRDSLTPNILQATIAMIPKLDQDTSWANFHPILASRLNKVIHTLIHKDQVGFVPLCQAADNIRCTILPTHYARQRSQQLMLLSLDLRKAFHTLSWMYLRAVLHYRGIGYGFLS